MTKLTITEGLAELKTLRKRIEKKQSVVLNNLLRQDTYKDPLHAEGGSPAVIAGERQAIADLEQRFLDIRLAISKANNETPLTIGDETHSIAHWLVWKRDVAPAQQQFTGRMVQEILNIRTQAQNKGLIVAPSGGTTHPDDVVVNVNEAELHKQSERYVQILGDLDGQLSLKNATVFIDV